MKFPEENRTLKAASHIRDFQDNKLSKATSHMKVHKATLNRKAVKTRKHLGNSP